MMGYFRKFLIFIRKEDNRSDLKPAFAGRMLIASIIGVVLGITLDIILPFGFLFNMIRGVIANFTGACLFCYGYLIGVRARYEKVQIEPDYKSIRKKYSYRQRLNISIALSGALIVFILTNGNVSPIYTLKATLSITAALTLIAFSRRTRNEFIKDVYQIPDMRDIEFFHKKREKISARRNKQNQK